LHLPRVSQLLLPSCSFPDTRNTTNTFSWYKKSISDGFPGITEKIIEIPAERLGFPQFRLLPFFFSFFGLEDPSQSLD